MHQSFDNLDGIGIDRTTNGVSPCEYRPKPPPLVRVPDWIENARSYKSSLESEYKPLPPTEWADSYELRKVVSKYEDGIYAADSTPSSTTIRDLDGLIAGLWG